MLVKERFYKYVAYDTQSSEESESFPSTDKQKVLLACLKKAMEYRQYMVQKQMY